jgi:hypothetical protein
MDVLKATKEKLQRQHELTTLGYDLDGLAKRVEVIFGLGAREIYSQGKYRRLIKPRSVFCYWAVRELGETATSLAKRLGITQSGVSKCVSRGETVVKELGINVIPE